MASVWGELKRRNVLRVGAAYVVMAWLLIQVAETIFPLFGFDDTPARIVVIVLAIGFVPALVLTWVFELTPEGIKREADVDRSQSITNKTARRLDRAMVARELGDADEKGHRRDLGAAGIRANIDAGMVTPTILRSQAKLALLDGRPEESVRMLSDAIGLGLRDVAELQSMFWDSLRVDADCRREMRRQDYLMQLLNWV